MAICNIRMVIMQPSHSKTKPFANRTTFDHLNTGLVQYSDGYCTRQNSMFKFKKSGIQMPRYFYVLYSNGRGNLMNIETVKSLCDVMSQSELTTLWYIETVYVIAGLTIFLFALKPVSSLSWPFCQTKYMQLMCIKPTHIQNKLVARLSVIIQ